MEPFVTKMRQYLQMDTEISFAEFKDYYEQIIDHLQKNYEGMDNDELIKVRFVLDIVSNNGQARAMRKGLNSKKYKKMADKSMFWSDAVNLRLQKNGLTQQEIDERVEKLNEAC